MITYEHRKEAIALIDEACTSGARRHKACQLLNLSIRTIERWKKVENKIDLRQLVKRTPKNKLTEEERSMILYTANSQEYRDLPPCKIVPLLADADKYIASESSFYRVLREANQLTHRTKCKSKQHKKPTSYTATKPNQIWSWDITYLPTQIKGLYFYMYVIMDIYSRKIVGWHVHEQESSDHAAFLIAQACYDENINRDQIVLHSDNGSPMKGCTMIAMLNKLGITPSFSRPSVSDDNPYSESLFKTAKYNALFPADAHFSQITDARNWGSKFANWYNNEHLHSGLKFITPTQRHLGLDKNLMQNRIAVYTKAKEKFPERWSRNTRNWQLPEEVFLNPNKQKTLAKGTQITHSSAVFSMIESELALGKSLRGSLKNPDKFLPSAQSFQEVF